MDMKTIRIITLSFMLLGIVLSAEARGRTEYPRAEIKVGYNYHHLALRNDGEVLILDYDYLLLANTECSKYYNRNNEYLDSLQSTPQGRKLHHQLISIGVEQYLKTGDDSSIPHKKGNLYVLKSHKDGITTVYDKYGLTEQGYYSEPFTEIEWTITDSVKNVLGYECVMAETDYHGRHWSVWFAPDIPLQDGPWKFCGLPGLILEATDSSGQHRFTATGLEKCNMEMYLICQPEKYDKMNRRDMLKAYAAYLKGSEAYSRAMIMDTPDRNRPDMYVPVAPKANTQNIDFPETDYH